MDVAAPTDTSVLPQARPWPDSSANDRLKIALIGHGAIGRLLRQTLAAHRAPIDTVAILVRPRRLAETRLALAGEGVEGVQAVDSIEALLAVRPHLVVECAGQEALRAFAEPVLAAGCDLMAIATGAFGDFDFYRRLEKLAARHGARVHLPAGAIAGLDGLMALRAGGLSSVKYISTKPPNAWLGTPAEHEFDLGALREATVIFRGKPADAGRLYPKNANLAVTVALAGIGLERTEIELVADPAMPVGSTRGRIEAVGGAGTLTVDRFGEAMPDNPKTGAITALSMAADLMKLARSVDW